MTDQRAVPPLRFRSLDLLIVHAVLNSSTIEIKKDAASDVK